MDLSPIRAFSSGIPVQAGDIPDHAVFRLADPDVHELCVACSWLPPHAWITKSRILCGGALTHIRFPPSVAVHFIANDCGHPWEKEEE